MADDTQSPSSGETTKWREMTRKFSHWDTPHQRAVQTAEASLVATWLLEHNLSHYDILEIGCGNGQFGATIVEKLKQAQTSYNYHFTDFLPECIEYTKSKTQSQLSDSQLQYSVLDVYNIDQSLPPASQSIILSTGFASAATYKDAVPKVASVLKQDGLLICDFVNHSSPIKLLAHPIKSFRRFFKLQSSLKVNQTPAGIYHFGAFGLREFFDAHGLTLTKQTTIGWQRNPLICEFKKNH